MKISRIDVIGQNGNDGAAYDGFGAEWLMQSGLIASSGEITDQRGQASLPDPVEGARPQGAGEAEAGKRPAGSCSGECASCRCGGSEGGGGEMTAISLPWPPSNNTYYRRVGAKTLISAKGRSYCKDVTALCQVAGVQKMEGRLQVVITACPPDRRRRDLDNLCKGLLDALTHGGAWEDDSQIDHLTIKRGPIKALGCVEVTISEIDGEAA